MQKQYQTYINDFYKAKNSLDYYTSNGITQADTITRISQISYEKGEIGYVEYIQNLKTAVEIHLQRTNAVNDYNQTIIMLNYVQGNKSDYERNIYIVNKPVFDITSIMRTKYKI